MATLTNVKVVLLKEDMDELFPKLIKNYPALTLQCKREDFKTIDCEYSLLSLEWVKWYNTGYKTIVESFLTLHRHSICEVTEDGYNEHRYQVQDKNGCDEEFEYFLRPSCSINDSYLREMKQKTHRCEFSVSVKISSEEFHKHLNSFYSLCIKYGCSCFQRDNDTDYVDFGWKNGVPDSQVIRDFANEMDSILAE